MKRMQKVIFLSLVMACLASSAIKAQMIDVLPEDICQPKNDRAPKVTIVLIDSGIDVNNDSLMSHVRKNPHEIAGNNIDDDGDECVDDVIGCNVFNSTDDVYDLRGHGTYVASVLIGKSNLVSRYASYLNEEVNFFPVKALTPNRLVTFSDGKIVGTYYDALKVSGSVESAAKAIKLAVAYRKKSGDNVILNCSWSFEGIPPQSEILSEAFRLAREAGILVVVAAGNFGEEHALSYPASIGGSNMISVGATLERKFAEYSSKGADIATDGTNIPNLGQGYASVMRGTSFSAPVVSVAAYQIWADHPYWTVEEVKERIIKTADTAAYLNGKVQERRLLNFQKAVAR